MKNAIAKRLPSYIRTPLGFMISPRVRKRIYTERRIRKQQNKAIHQFDAAAKKMVVFLVAGADMSTGKDKISGGIISIVSLCQESAKMKDIHDAQVIMCTLRNEHLLFRHTQFENHTDVFRFDQLQAYFSAADEVLFHIPEFICDYFLGHLTDGDRKWLAGLKDLHINILNQNIRYMPAPEVIDRLRRLAGKVTNTTAHQKYCNPHYRALFNIPVHKFSVWISPEQYQFRQYAEKENLIVVSPDMSTFKQEVLEQLSSIPGLKVQIIKNLTYEQYKETIARAKWTLTFGEGLDGYLIEPIFSGAIGFAVYNEDFFTPDFKGKRTLYGSYEELLKTIKKDISELDEPAAFAAYQKKQFDLCARYYSQEEYRSNIRAFYRGQYSLP
jgi:hypothetical protein